MAIGSGDCDEAGVLFVDDEQNIPDGLRDLLRKYRQEIETVFALGAEAAALDELRYRRLSTSSSPTCACAGMNGAMLLQRVKDEYPDVIRIILSGHSDRDSIFMQQSPVAHQFLCETLRSEPPVQRHRASLPSCARLLTDDSLLKSAGHGGIEKLPSLPAVILIELTAAMARPGHLRSNDRGHHRTGSGDVGKGPSTGQLRLLRRAGQYRQHRSRSDLPRHRTGSGTWP